MKESCDVITNVVVMIITMSLTVVAILKVPTGHTLLHEKAPIEGDFPYLRTVNNKEQGHGRKSDDTRGKRII